MKPQSIFGAVTALGILSSAASTPLIGTTAALADDWSNSNDRPAWSQRCDRNWDSAYCNPKANSNNQEWSDSDFNRNRDAWNRDGDQWYSRDLDQWRNSTQGQWQSRDQDYWRNQQRRSYSIRLSEGTYIPTYPERSGRRIVLRAQERYPLTLIVSQDVGRASRRGIVALPRNSRIEGSLVPTRNGYRFEANQVRLPNGQSSRIWATSNVFRQNDAYDRDYRRDSTSSSRGESLLSAIFGRSNSSNSTINGDIYGRYPDERYPDDRYSNNNWRDLVVINPDQSFDLRLTRDFVLDWRNF